MRAKVLTVVGLALAVAPAAAQETLFGSPDITVAYYDVSGGSDRAIIRDIESKKIGVIGGGKAAWGLTVAQFQYGWPQRSDGACDLSQAKVSYTINVQLPKMASGVRLQKETMDWWKVASHNLRIHEIDHVRLALGYARELEKAIKAANCSTAEDEAKRVIEAYHAANAKYDELTKHGTTVPRRSKRKD